MSEGADQQDQTLLVIARGGSTAFLGRLGFMVLGYLFALLLARELGTEEYGLFVLAFSVVNIGSASALLGLNRGLVRFVSLHRGVSDRERESGTLRAAFLISLVTSLAATGLLMALANPLVKLLNAPDSFAGHLRGFATWIPFWAVLYILAATTEAIKRLELRVAFFDIGWPLSRILLTWAAFYLGFKFEGIIWAGLGASIGSILLGMALMRPYINDLRKVQPVYSTRNLLSFSLPIMLLNLVVLTQNQLEVYLLSALQSPEASGIFNVAARTAILSAVFLEGLGLIFAPIIADLTFRKKTQELKNLLTTVTRWSFTAGIAVFSFTLFFGEPILGIFGRSYEIALVPLIVLSAAHMVNAATGPVGYVINMAGYSRVNLVNSVLTLALNIFLVAILIPPFGILGAAIGGGLAIILVNLLRVYEVYHLLGIHAYNRKFVKPLLAAVIAGPAAFLFITAIDLHSNLAAVLGGGVAFGFLFIAMIGVMGLDESDIFVIHTFRDRLFSIKP